MRTITLPGTAIEVSKFSFGTASLHHLPRWEDRLKLLRTAHEAGFSHFDTSPLYGYGLAEEALGHLTREVSSEVTIATKVGLYPPAGASCSSRSVWIRKALGKFHPKLSRAVVDWNIERAEASLKGSLKRLKREYVDILMLHEANAELLQADEWLLWLDSQRRQGTIRAYGLAGELEPILPWIKDQKDFPFILQIPDSLSGREADPLLKLGKPLQFTFGYFSAVSSNKPLDPISFLKQVLERSPSGSVIVSTRNLDHLQHFPKVASV